MSGWPLCCAVASKTKPSTPGDRAPSITALAAEQGGWARQTCAKALQALEAERFPVRVPGLGYFIADPASTSEGSEPQQSPVLRVADLHAQRKD
jgi:DNA-binding transcriptional regulator YhcF (GntR family)